MIKRLFAQRVAGEFSRSQDRLRSRGRCGADGRCQARANLIINRNTRFDWNLEANGHCVRDRVLILSRCRAARDDERKIFVISQYCGLYALPLLVEYGAAPDRFIARLRRKAVRNELRCYVAFWTDVEGGHTVALVPRVQR